MKKLSKIVVSLLCLSLSFGVLTLTTYAQTPQDSKSVSTTINEYDLYKSLISKSDSELKNDGLSTSDISNLRKFDYKQAIIDRANLSQNELKNIGYSDQSIASLKSLSTELKSNAITLNALDSSSSSSYAGATLTTTVTSVPSLTSTSDVCFGVSYYWSQEPLFNYTNSFAVSWKAENSTGSPINVQIGNGPVSSYGATSNIDIEYFSTITGDFYSDPIYNWTIKDKWRSAYVNFNSSISGSKYNPAWNKCGYGEIFLNQTGSDGIHKVDICVAFGFTTIGISPSFSVGTGGADISITYTKPIATMGEQSCVIDSNGNMS